MAAWGSNSEGQCDVPAELDDAIAIAAGGNHSLAFRRNGEVVAWGSNSQGQCTVPEGLNLLPETPVWTGGGLTASNIETDSVTLEWTPASFPAYAYQVFVNRSIYYTSFTSYTMTSLSPGTEYTFQIAAMDSTGQWVPGPELVISTLPDESGGLHIARVSRMGKSAVVTVELTGLGSLRFDLAVKQNGRIVVTRNRLVPGSYDFTISRLVEGENKITVRGIETNSGTVLSDSAMIKFEVKPVSTEQGVSTDGDGNTVLRLANNMATLIIPPGAIPEEVTVELSQLNPGPRPPAGGSLIG